MCVGMFFCETTPTLCGISTRGWCPQTARRRWSAAPAAQVGWLVPPRFGRLMHQRAVSLRVDGRNKSRPGLPCLPQQRLPPAPPPPPRVLDGRNSRHKICYLYQQRLRPAPAPPASPPPPPPRPPVFHVATRVAGRRAPSQEASAAAPKIGPASE